MFLKIASGLNVVLVLVPAAVAAGGNVLLEGDARFVDVVNHSRLRTCSDSRRGVGLRRVSAHRLGRLVYYNFTSLHIVLTSHLSLFKNRLQQVDLSQFW